MRKYSASNLIMVLYSSQIREPTKSTTFWKFYADLQEETLHNLQTLYNLQMRPNTDLQDCKHIGGR